MGTPYFHALESRLFLNATITDIAISYAIDHDSDGANRASTATVVIQSSAPTPAYFKVFEVDEGGTDELVYRSALFNINDTLAAFSFDMRSDTWGLPGDDLDGFVEFRVELFDGIYNTLMSSRDWHADPSLGPARYESSLQDGGQVGAAPVVSAPWIDPPGATPLGEPFMIYATVTDASPSGHAAVAAAFWVDTNLNGVFDPATEGITFRGLTLSSGTTASGEWSTQTVALPELGSGTIPGMITAWDADGNASASVPLPVTIGDADFPPMITSVIYPAIPVNNGSAFTLLVSATDDHGILQVDCFVDCDHDGVFNPDLGDIAGPLGVSSGSGWSLTLSALPSYQRDGVIHIVVQALDTRLQTSGPFVVDVLFNAAPTVTAVTIDGQAVDGAPRTLGTVLTIHAAASDDRGLPAAMTFFVDKNNDGRWSAGVDLDLGADYDGADGFSRTVTLTSAWGTLQQTVRVLAAARDAGGLWSPPVRAPGVRINDRPSITMLTSSLASVQANKQVLLTASVTDSNPRAVTFYLDANGNGGWDPFIDTDLGADTDPAGGWTRTVTMYAGWISTTPLRIVADVMDADGVWASTPRAWVAVTVTGPGISFVTSMSSAFGFGQTMVFAASAVSVRPLRAVTFFLDKNTNGRWDAGTDIDLGACTQPRDDWRISTLVTSAWGARDDARICAAAVDIDGVWSVPLSTTPVRILDAPTVTYVSAAPMLVQPGGLVAFEASAVYERGVRAVTSFVDLNNDGRWTAGVDVDLGLASRISGTSTDGIWRNTRSWTLGTGFFTIIMDAVGFNGQWSGRPFATALMVI